MEREGRGRIIRPSSFFVKILFIYFYRGERREGEKLPCRVVSRAPPTGDLAHSAGMCPRLGIKLVTPWFAGTQSTEPHQPGLDPLLKMFTGSISITGCGEHDVEARELRER